MDLFSKSMWVFVSILFMFIVVVLFPTPAVIGLVILGTSLIAIWQTFIILTDETTQDI